MLSKKDNLTSLFESRGRSKQIDCIRVDGAADEGPGHESIQFWWTLWHVTQSKAVTLVTTRCSGSSYLNRVELQNGSLSLGHANTFIPSTLNGSCLNPETGSIDESNFSSAIDAYISRVDNCPCGGSSINLFRGSDSEEFQNVSQSLDIFLKGSKHQKEILKHQHPDLFGKFVKV